MTFRKIRHMAFDLRSHKATRGETFVILDSVRQYLVISALTANLMISLGPLSLGQDEMLKPREATGVVVDEAGTPVAQVEVDTLESTLARPERTDNQGAFRFFVDRGPSRMTPPGLVLARDGDARLGLGRLSPLYAEKVEPLRIVLKKPKDIKIRVVDGSNRPVESAGVRFEASGSAFSLGSTDANGNVSLRLPDEPREWCVAAFKGAVGYDCERPSRPNLSPRNAPPPALPEQVTLHLTGARRPVRIRTVDHQGDPVAGVRIRIQQKGGPFFGFAKPGQTRSGPLPELATDENGTVAIDWLPNWVDLELTYTGAAPDRKHLAREMNVSCDPTTGEAKILMLPMQTVSGRITLSDGKPAARASVRIIPLTRSGGPFSVQTKTDGGGHYKSPVRSQDGYVLYASLDEAAQVRRDAFVVTPDKPVTNIDLAIARATDVKGRVFLDRDGKPFSGFGMISVWTSTGPLPAEVRKLLHESPNQSQVILLEEFYRKDKEFRLLLPRGSYTIRFSYFQDKAEQLHDVAISIPLFFPPRELKRDLILSEIPKVK
jgi:hypothetical protein